MRDAPLAEGDSDNDGARGRSDSVTANDGGDTEDRGEMAIEFSDGDSVDEAPGAVGGGIVVVEVEPVLTDYVIPTDSDMIMLLQQLALLL